MHQLPASDVADMLETLIRACRELRPLLLERAGTVDSTSKTDGSPVTDTDREAETTLIHIFSQQYPEIPIFGEEGGYSSDLPKHCWLIDPIDGTKNFVAGSMTFTTMATCISEGEAIGCLIYVHATDDVFTAQKDLGAYKNGSRIDLARTQPPARVFSKSKHIPGLKEALSTADLSYEVSPDGGGFGFTQVSEGTVAARFQMESKGYVHDYAPGGLLIAEAGGAVIPIQEKSYTYKTTSFVACHPALEAVIRSHIQEIRLLESR